MVKPIKFLSDETEYRYLNHMLLAIENFMILRTEIPVDSKWVVFHFVTPEDALSLDEEKMAELNKLVEPSGQTIDEFLASGSVISATLVHYPGSIGNSNIVTWAMNAPEGVILALKADVDWNASKNRLQILLALANAGVEGALRQVCPTHGEVH